MINTEHAMHATRTTLETVFRIPTALTRAGDGATAIDEWIAEHAEREEPGSRLRTLTDALANAGASAEIRVREDRTADVEPEPTTIVAEVFGGPDARVCVELDASGGGELTSVRVTAAGPDDPVGRKAEWLRVDEAAALVAPGALAKLAAALRTGPRTRFLDPAASLAAATADDAELESLAVMVETVVHDTAASEPNDVSDVHVDWTAERTRIMARRDGEYGTEAILPALAGPAYEAELRARCGEGTHGDRYRVIRTGANGQDFTLRTQLTPDLELVLVRVMRRDARAATGNGDAACAPRS